MKKKLSNHPKKYADLYKRRNSIEKFFDLGLVALVGYRKNLSQENSKWKCSLKWHDMWHLNDYFGCDMSYYVIDPQFSAKF